MANSVENRLIDTSEFKELVDQLASKIIAEGTKYDIMLCITWWGLFLSYYLSKRLGIEIIETYWSSSYDHDWTPLEKSRVFKKPDPTSFILQNVLAVDDLVDWGWTANDMYNTYKDYVSKIDLAVLLTKAWYKCDPGLKIFTVEEGLDPNQYIDFYYEKM